MNTVKLLLVLSFMFVQVFCKADQRPYVASTTDAISITLSVTLDIKKGKTGNSSPKTPLKSPTLLLSDNTLFLYGQFADSYLEIKNDDNDVVYYALNISSNTYSVALPDFFSGKYRIIISDGNYLYSGVFQIA